MYKIATVLLVLLAIITSSAANAEYKLFDFETDANISAWTLRSPQQDKLVRNEEFSSSGQSSMQFISPAYKPGMDQWPAFEIKPPLADWREYDRLVVDIINPSTEATQLLMHISDSKVPFRQALMYRFDTPRMGYRRFVIPLSLLPANVDRSDISIIHIFSVTPADMRLCLDNFVLLKPNEPEPGINPGLGKQIAGLMTGAIQQAVADFNKQKGSLKGFDKDPVLKKIVNDRMAFWDNMLKTLPERMAACTDPQQMTALESEIKLVTKQSGRLRSELMLIRDYKALRMPDNGMLIGFAASMSKVLPRDMPFSLNVSRNIGVSLARNEKEAFQVAVMPLSNGLRGVSVSVSNLKGPKGQVLQSRNISCEVMGYVETVNNPPYEVSYIGWWPDPILDFLGPINIAAGDLQTFWIRVKAPKNQLPGVYKGKLTVSQSNGKPSVFNLSVKVRSFTMPDCTPLPTAITAIHPGLFQQIRDNVVGGAEKWSKMKYVYADFLADYYINFDNLYNDDPPDFEILKHLHDQGRLATFNFGYFTADTAADLARYRPIYAKAKELGILDHAYIYGYDEQGAGAFPSLETATKALKTEFPEIPVMTTSYDPSYGLNSVVTSMDAWCPLTPTYGDTIAQAEKARAAGKMIWWYICCAPSHPYANWFVEYDAIEIRELMGAMTAKYRPDGFLYYSLAFWNNYMPITSGPFTTWNPVSYGTYHGDGTIFCPGPNGRPLPTIRLENYRDGMEDFAYTKILEDIITKYESKSTLTKKEQTWLTNAKQTVKVPDTIVKSLVEYNRDPKRLNDYREKIATLIDTSGMPAVDPWGKNFGVRGFGK